MMNRIAKYFHEIFFPSPLAGEGRVRGLVVLITLLLLATFQSAHAEEFDAVLQWSHRVELSTPVSGVIVEVNVQPGQHVKKDEVLLRLDTTVRAANVDHTKAQMTKHTRLRDEAQRELDRSLELFNATLLAEHEMELARIAFDAAEAEFQKARATLAQAESDLKYSEIRAPYDAIILQRYAEVGQTVASQLQVTPLLVVAEDGRMLATANVSSQRAQALKLGQSATVKVGGKSFEGTVQRLALDASKTKQGEVRHAVEIVFTPDRTLRAGEVAGVVLR